MRGLVVVGLALGLLFLLSNLGSAEPTGDAKPVVPPVTISCHIKDGATVLLKANEDVRDVEIGDYCSHELVPAGWSVVCRTDQEPTNVEVSYVVRGDERRTVVVCS